MWKNYQRVINNTHNIGNIKTYHHFICLIPEVPKFTALFTGTLREIIVNDTTTIDKVSLNWLGVTVCEFRGVYMMLKIGIEVERDYTVFNHRPPIP